MTQNSISQAPQNMFQENELSSWTCSNEEICCFLFFFFFQCWKSRIHPKCLVLPYKKSSNFQSMKRSNAFISMSTRKRTVKLLLLNEVWIPFLARNKTCLSLGICSARETFVLLLGTTSQNIFLSEETVTRNTLFVKNKQKKKPDSQKDGPMGK